ncbi:cyclin-like protein [Xylariaceae sp. FL1019]|nr:cyclin-like protein [Xylariaceae sp. FL1019]
MAPTINSEHRPDADGAADSESKGPPNIGAVKCGRVYLHEITIRRKLASMNVDPAREQAARLQGVQLIDDVRNYLQLPVNTYAAASSYFHRFRLKFPGSDQTPDVPLACLFVACKSEDTLKKSKDILCANHNLKNPDRTTTPDDKMFEQSSKMMHGTERQIIEAIRFDFQVRKPHKILAKIVKSIVGPRPEASQFFDLAYQAGIDMYKTLTPLKHTTYTCAVMVAQLTSMVTGQFEEAFTRMNLKEFFTCEEWVAEAMIDLLDLYTDYTKSTLLGQGIDLQVFINVKIRVNKKMDAARIPRYANFCNECERERVPPSPSSIGSSPASPNETSSNASTKRGTKGSEGTMRFLFDADEARQEKRIYEKYTRDEYDEWEEEVEEPIPDPRENHRADLGPEPRPPREPRGPRGRGRGRGGRGGQDWHPRGGRGRRGGRGGFY